VGLKRPELFAALYPTGPKCRATAVYGWPRINRQNPTEEIPAAKLAEIGGKPPMLPDGQARFFDYLDLVAFVEQTHRDLPFPCFIGGREGRKPWAGYAPWEDNVAMVKALTRNRHGFGFGWDNKGHGSARVQFEKLKQYYPPQLFALNRSYPAFGNSSIDDDLGPNGPDEGYVNVGFAWKDVVDEAGKWSATISNGEAKADMTADVTPRRCQNFKPAAGEKLRWTSSSGAAGDATADQWGLVTVEKLAIPLGKPVTLTIQKAGGAR
jgi:hypothetical protein